MRPDPQLHSVSGSCGEARFACNGSPVGRDPILPGTQLHFLMQPWPSSLEKRLPQEAPGTSWHLKHGVSLSQRLHKTSIYCAYMDPRFFNHPWPFLGKQGSPKQSRVWVFGQFLLITPKPVAPRNRVHRVIQALEVDRTSTLDAASIGTGQW